MTCHYLDVAGTVDEAMREINQRKTDTSKIMLTDTVTFDKQNAGSSLNYTDLSGLVGSLITTIRRHRNTWLEAEEGNVGSPFPAVFSRLQATTMLRNNRHQEKMDSKQEADEQGEEALTGLDFDDEFMAPPLQLNAEADTDLSNTAEAEAHNTIVPLAPVESEPDILESIENAPQHDNARPPLVKSEDNVEAASLVEAQPNNMTPSVVKSEVDADGFSTKEAKPNNMTPPVVKSETKTDGYDKGKWTLIDIKLFVFASCKLSMSVTEHNLVSHYVLQRKFHFTTWYV